MNQDAPKDVKSLFDFSIWKRALIENSHKRERKRLEMVDCVWKAIHHLSHTYQWEELYIFGSVTKSKQFGRHSDVDIGVQGLDKLQHFRFIADLSNIIERDVDVLRLEDCFFADVIRKRGIRWKKKE
jgi:predicted nucleotidyltransferase